MAFLEATIVAAVAILGVVAPAAGPQDRPSAEPTAFLERLTGEWSVVAEVTLGPGQEPVRTESRAVARLLGGKWLVVESTGTAPGGQPVTSILTLGYDPGEERFVGT